MPVIPGDSLTLLAPAKINLSLRVLGRRPDGYHNLDTVMQKLDLFDRLSLTVTSDPAIVLHCPDSGLPEDDTNIVFRAAAAFLSALTGRAGHGGGDAGPMGVTVTLEKRIPVAAGLGGGSSDAGAALVGLNRLFKTPFSVPELLSMARPLGADVPFFVTDYGAVRAQGIGDQMTAVPSLSNCSVVLVNPGFAVSTRWVYEKYALTTGRKDSKILSSQNDEELGAPVAGINDLEQVTIPAYPEIEVCKQELLALGASVALMSGSGPTVFAIFPDEEKRQARSVQGAVEALQDRGRGLAHGRTIFVTRPV